MAKNKKKAPPLENEEIPVGPDAPMEPEAAPDTDGPSAPDAGALQTGLEEARKSLAVSEEKFLRLAAEYDNFRKRTAKEKEGIWGDATAAAVTALLPVFDNLERALKQETADAAYKKGVEMTMTGLRDALAKLGVEEIPAQGETFDPNLHNAVMHVEDENAEENTIVEVFQQGFTCGGKVVRFAMVKVAN